MNNDLLLHIAQALGQNWGLLLVLLACVGWGSLLVFAYLKKISAGRFTDAELVSLSLSGWPMPALVLSLFLLLLRLVLPNSFVTILGLVLLLLSAGMAARTLWGKVAPAASLPVLLFLFFVLVRISYVVGAVLPAYFDSAEHYRIILSLLNAPFAWPATSYYHLGYHIIVAAFTAVTGADLAQVMLVFGQVIVAALALPMYVFVRRVTSSDYAAFFAVVLTAFGWFVPAHAANWGKYPALLGMLAFQFTLGLAVIDQRKLALLSIPFAVLIHTRMAILLALCLVAWILPRRAWVARALGLGMLGILIWRYRDFGPLWNANGNSNLGAIWEAYGGSTLGPLWGAYGNWIMLLVGLLVVLAARAFPRLTVVSFLAILLGLTATVLPPSFPVLDRPLTEMVLSLPLAFLGGLGAARIPKPAVIILVAAILFHAWTAYSFAPSSCCQLAGRDDLTALDWVKQNTPTDAHLAIASTDLSLTSSTSMLATGTDAGIWVTPLSGRGTLSLPYSADFSQSEVHTYLCENKVTYIYIGGTQQSFESGKLQGRPDWYGVIFALPKAQVVQVLGCSN